MRGIKDFYMVCWGMKKKKYIDEWCKKCKRPKMPVDSTQFGGSSEKQKSKVHWGVLFAFLCVVGGWIIPGVQRKEDETLTYYPAKFSYLKKKLPAIKISGIDFVSETMRIRNQDLMYEMDYICKERSDDVIFAFQFGVSGKQRRREDHVFALCQNPSRVYGNAEIVAHGETEIMCTEEYGGQLQQVRRRASVSIKAIDIRSWEVIEYDVANEKESCIIQHAIDILESKWI